MDKKPNSQRANSKLAPKDFTLVLRLAGEGYTPVQIITELDSKEIPHPSRQAIQKILTAETNQQEIDEFRKDYHSKIEKVPIFHKRIRLDQLQKTLDRINGFIDRMQGNHGNIGKKDLNKFLSLTKRLDDILKSAREEVEKRPAQLQLIQTFTGGQLTDEELIAEERRIDRDILRFRERGVSITDTSKNTPPEGAGAEEKSEPA